MDLDLAGRRGRAVGPDGVYKVLDGGELDAGFLEGLDLGDRVQPGI